MFIIALGLFGFFNFKSSEKRFVSTADYKKNRKAQQERSMAVLGQLRKNGVISSHNYKLEFFFYTDTKDKAKALAIEGA